ncbi:hypothetical protein [Burkholderia vietnamiensis]|nr:hypothetical protein [Burkholderia vietnamiensis]
MQLRAAWRALDCALLAAMHLKHRYHHNLIGALISAFLYFLLIEGIPALT